MWKLLLLALLAAACTTTADYNERLHGFVGKPITYVIEKNGAPSVTIPLPDGKMIYEWQFYGSSVTTRTGTNQYTSSGRNVTCLTGLETDANGIVTRWYWKGNCR